MKFRLCRALYRLLQEVNQLAANAGADICTISFQYVLIIISIDMLFLVFLGDCSKPCQCATKSMDQNAEYSPESKPHKGILPEMTGLRETEF